MMTKVEQFITKVFTTLVKNFPNGTILYEYKDVSDTHFLKVTPISLYNSEEFVEFSSDLVDEFYEKDFDGMLCFLTEGALTELHQPTKKHLPEDALIKTVEIFDETIGFLNIFVNNDEGILRTIEFSSFKNREITGNFSNLNSAMAA